jgi:uncharacterized membrane protein YccF (DUF307 family)
MVSTIPFGLQSMKLGMLAKLALSPFGKELV